jgi:hypothetical protein
LLVCCLYALLSSISVTLGIFVLVGDVVLRDLHWIDVFTKSCRVRKIAGRVGLVWYSCIHLHTSTDGVPLSARRSRKIDEPELERELAMWISVFLKIRRCLVEDS